MAEDAKYRSSLCGYMDDREKWENFLINVAAKNVQNFNSEKDKLPLDVTLKRVINYRSSLKLELFVPGLDENYLNGNYPVPKDGCLFEDNKFVIKTTVKHVKQFNRAEKLRNDTQILCVPSDIDPKKSKMIVTGISLKMTDFIDNDRIINPCAADINSVYFFAGVKLEVPDPRDIKVGNVFYAAPSIVLLKGEKDSILYKILVYEETDCISMFTSGYCFENRVQNVDARILYNFVIDYLDFLQNLKHGFMSRYLEANLQSIVKLESIKQFFASELIKIAKTAASLIEQITVDSFIKSDATVENYLVLLENMKKFPIDILKNDNKYNEHNSLYDYVYSAVMTRSDYLRNTSEYYLITDVPGYFEAVTQDLTNIARKNQRIKSILRQRDDYALEINKKIKEGVDLIKNEINPEFTRIEERLKKNIQRIVEETMEIQKDNTDRINQLNKKKEEVKYNFILSIVCSCFKFLGTVVGAVVNTVMPGVGSMIQIGSNKVIGKAQSIIQKHVIGETIVKDVKMPDAISNRRKREDEKGDLEKEKETSEAKKNLEEDQEKKGIKEQLLDSAKTEIESISKDIETFQTGNDELDNAILEAKNNDAKLRAFLEKIEKEIKPFLEEFFDEMESEQSQINKRSRIALEIKKYQIKSKLDDIGKKLENLSAGFSEQEDLQTCIETYNEAMQMMMKIFDYIQEYEENKKFATYIADLHIQDNNVTFSDPEITTVVATLKVLFEKSVALKSYETAMNAFKQFVFPLADYYFKRLVTPPQLEQDYGKNVDDMITQAKLEIAGLNKQLIIYKNSIESHDMFLGAGEFESVYISGKPFYVWECQKYAERLNKLLRGEEVYFYANITDSKCKQDAIKLNQIDISIKTKDKGDQGRLNVALKYFRISATHLGNNHYRFQNKTYLITTAVQDVWYNFERSFTGNKPVHTSSAYDKIHNGDFMLSPFAMWKLRITYATETATYDMLTEFIGKVTLELGGHGFYIDSNKIKEEHIELDTYYKDAIIQSDTGTASKANVRDKRSVDTSYASSSAAQGISSPINSLCNLLIETMKNPLQQVKRLFYSEDISDDTITSYRSSKHYSSIVNNDFIINVDSSRKIADPNRFINGESNQYRELYDTSFDLINNQNLALLSFAVNKFTNVKQNKKTTVNIMLKNDEQSQYAQMLAYSAQAPKLLG